MKINVLLIRGEQFEACKLQSVVEKENFVT